MISRFIHFILAFLTVSIGLFILFDQVIMPAYIRKDQTITVMDVKGKLLDRALRELDSEGFKGLVFDTVYTSKVDPLTIIDQYPLSGQKAVSYTHLRAHET